MTQKNRHLRTIAQICRAISSQLSHVSTTGKKLLNGNISSICLHFGRLTAEICWQVWGTPANLNGFRVLPSLLQRRRSPQANQTLHDVWPSPGLLHYIYIFGASWPLTEFALCKNHFTSVQVSRFRILAALLHGTPAAGVSQSLRHGTRNGIKAKFHCAMWSQTGPKLIADMQRAGIWPII